MAAITGSFKTYDAVANREDLTDEIYDISPSETPFVSAIGRTKAKNTYHEWQTDSLAAASSTNAQLEGVQFGYATSAPTTRNGNYCQISTKDIVVSGTERAMDHAGIDDFFVYQTMKKGKELRLDVDTAISQVQGQVAGDSTTARKTRALGSWLTSNVSRATNGANATAATAAPTDGTQRAFTETLLKAVIKSAWDNGGKPDLLLVGSFNKQAASAFTGRTQARQNVSAATILGAASLYASDFGDIKIVPGRNHRARDAFLLDPEYAAVAYLRGFGVNNIAKVGDADAKQLIVEYALEMRNEKAHGVVADLTTS
jgi:hypothetical protein